MTVCYALGCKHSEKNCTMFKFPSDIVRRKFWIKNCRRPFATTKHRLCKHHFRKGLYRKKHSKWALARNAIPTIFKNSHSQKKSKKSSTKMRNEEEEKICTESSNFDVQFRIADCWSEQEKANAKRELLSAIYEDSNPLGDDPEESYKQCTTNQPLGLENIPMLGSDISSESKIEFSYSTPKKLNDLTPILAKWSPKINNVVSIIEDLIDSSDDDEDRSNEEISSNHVIYIDEDSVKQEEFVDENSEESSDCESSKSSKKEREEINCSFDENKVKKEFHITDTLRVKLHKINVNGKFNCQPSSTLQSRTSNGILSKKKSINSSNKKKKLPKKSSNSKKSSKNSRTPQSNQRSKASHSNSRSKRPTTPEPTSQSKTRCNSNNKRQSLRLSGKSPEIKLPDYIPSITRSGRKRVYEEPKGKSTNAPTDYTLDDKEVSHRASKTDMGKELESVETVRSRSPSPTTYRTNIEVLFACQCCDEKYASVEQVKAHIRTHFPNCATN